MKIPSLLLVSAFLSPNSSPTLHLSCLCFLDSNWKFCRGRDAFRFVRLNATVYITTVLFLLSSFLVIFATIFIPFSISFSFPPFFSHHNIASITKVTKHLRCTKELIKKRIYCPIQTPHKQSHMYM